MSHAVDSQASIPGGWKERLWAYLAERIGLDAMLELEFEGDIYLSFDMDCLDPAFAPGVSHPEPGGLSTRDVLGLIQSLKGRLVGADIVEYNPERDLNGLTAAVGAKLLKEVLGRMLSEGA